MADRVRSANRNAPRMLGSVLVESDKVSEAQIAEAMRLKAREGIPLGQALLKMGLVNQEDIARALAAANNLEYVDIEQRVVEQAALDAVPPAIAQRHHLLPLALNEGRLVVAADRPVPAQVRRNVERTCRLSMVEQIAQGDALADAIARVFDDGTGLEEASGAVEAVDQMIMRAVRIKASDIHVEPFEDRVRVRYRVDGVLQEAGTFSPEMLSTLTSRIKVMSGMNVAERRTPQDGAIVFSRDGRDVDIRVSVLPSIYGEKVVMRILGGRGMNLKLTEIGLAADDHERLAQLIVRPYGIILIVGPTGSGKSTTLSAALNTINRPGINITTVEDPVEYKIDGITQVHVGQSDKISFAGALRSILRQDPDVIMIGEVRDSETAEIALRAALTGHMVFSTLHTNDAPSALPRLVDMGCERFLVASSISGILAQRLVRRLCPKCREPYEPSDEELAGLGLTRGGIDGPWFKKGGCPLCNGTGYRGRVGIFEMLEVDESIRRAVMEGVPAEVLGDLARKQGMRNLRQDALCKVCQGLTSVEEVLRVTTGD